MRPMLRAAVAGLIIVLGGNACAFSFLPHSSALRSMRCGTQGFEASALRLSASRQARCRQRTPGRSAGKQPLCMMAKSEDTGAWFGGFFANVFGGVKEANEDKTRVVNAITSAGGWDLSLDLGSQIARQLGGSGQLAKGDVMAFNIGVSVRLTLDEGYDPPQGSVFIASESSIFKGEGFWSVIEDTDQGIPSAIQANLKCPEGIKVSGETVIPPGNLYVNIKIKDEPPQEAAPVRGLNGVSFYNGRLTVKEDVKSSFMLTPYNGILAEFKIVGTCAAKPRPPL